MASLRSQGPDQSLLPSDAPVTVTANTQARPHHRPASMTKFATTRLPVEPMATAPDGSDVRILLRLEGGGMAHFELRPGETSQAVRHRTVGEIWFFLGGRGEMWRRLDGYEEIVPVDAGVCLTIPV